MTFETKRTTNVSFLHTQNDENLFALVNGWSLQLDQFCEKRNSSLSGKTSSPSTSKIRLLTLFFQQKWTSSDQKEWPLYKLKRTNQQWKIDSLQKRFFCVESRFTFKKSDWNFAKNGWLASWPLKVSQQNPWFLTDCKVLMSLGF